MRRVMVERFGGGALLVALWLSALSPVNAQSEAERILDAELEAEGGEQAPADLENALPVTPTLLGGSGLFYTTSAQTGEVLTFRLALSGQVFSGSDVVRLNDEASRFTGALNISATPLEWLEPYLVLQARSNANSFSEPDTVLAQGDTNLGAKAVYGVAPGLNLGADLRLMFLTGAGDTSFNFGATSVKFTGLATFDATELPSPLPIRAHLNLGILVDQSDQLLPEDEDGRKLIPTRLQRFNQGLSAFNQFQLGLGVEVPLAYVTPSLEYNLGVLVGDEPEALCGEGQPLGCPSEAGFGGNPQALTLGVKGMPLPGLILSAGVDIGLTSEDVQGVPVTPPWQVLFGLTYSFDPLGREKIVEVEKVVEKEKVVEVKPPAGVFLGRVVDVDTKKPIPNVTIQYMDMELTRQATDPETGQFRTYDLNPGDEVVMRFTAPDYKAKRVKRVIEEGESELEVTLRPLGSSGTIQATIKDLEGNPVRSGSLVLTGPRTYTVQLDGEPVSQKVLVGQYTVALTAPGFLTVGKDVEVKAGADIGLDLQLKPRPQEAVVSVGETRILMDGRLEFGDDDALTDADKAVLDQVVSALLEHPEFTRIRVESHWDDTGGEKATETTGRRAQVVMDYLVAGGISPKRLESKGYGGEQPLVPNTNARSRAINRRVEFAIVSTSAARE